MIISTIATIDIPWQAAAAAIVIVITALGGQVYKFFSEWLRYKKDRATDLQKQEYLKTIAEVSDHQTSILATILHENRMSNLTGDGRHKELVESIRGSCRQPKT